MSVTTFEQELHPREPTVQYCPVSDYDSTFQQLSMLKQMGYPIDIAIVPNDDEEMRSYYAHKYPGDETMEKEAPLHPYWAKCTIDPDFDHFIEFLEALGDVLQSSDEGIQRLLVKHPMQLITDVDMARVSPLYFMYQAHLPDSGASYHRLAHERDDYPWFDVISRCIVAAQLRYDRFVETSDSYNLESASTSAEAATFAQQLIQSGVLPINGEQIAGLVSDYYHLVERHFPEFVAFKQPTHVRSPREMSL